MKEKIFREVSNALKELAEDLNKHDVNAENEDFLIFGKDGSLGSIELVTLIADLEERIYETFGKEILLADEKTMSQYKTPFRSIKTLTNYIESLLGKINE